MPVFREEIDTQNINQVTRKEWKIDANCSKCACILAGDDLEEALQNMYSSEVATQVYEAYETKANFYSQITELFNSGIRVPFIPESVPDYE